MVKLSALQTSRLYSPKTAMGNGTGDLPACSAVPQTIVSPRASYQTCTVAVDKAKHYYINSHKHKFKPWRWKVAFCRKCNVANHNRIDADYRPWWIEIPASFSEGSSLNPDTGANYRISGLHFSSLVQGIFWDSTLKRAPITPTQSLPIHNPHTYWHLKPHYQQRYQA